MTIQYIYSYHHKVSYCRSTLNTNYNKDEEFESIKELAGAITDLFLGSKFFVITPPLRQGNCQVPHNNTKYCKKSNEPSRTT